MEPILQVENLTKQYPGFTLDHISFSVPRGTIVGLIGENGAGKSTTLKAILDLIRKDDGTVCLFGQELTEDRKDIKEDIGVVFDGIHFHETLTPKKVEKISEAAYKQWDPQVYQSYLRQFALPADKEIRILFSFVGMQEQERVVRDQKVLDVILKEEIAEMEEVIVTGYSTRKVSEMTGAVQQFRGKDIVQSATGGNLMNALKGHTTGLQITGSDGTPGKDGALLLRGLGTFYGNDDGSGSSSTPLIVIDGVITDYTSISGVISPSDIADITVLKDAASTAIYGSRAATGVIVVTTRKGIKDKMTVSLDVKMGISTPVFGGLKYMNSSELLEFGEMTLRNWWDTNENLREMYADRETFVQDTLGVLRNNFDLTKTTDWRDLAYRTGLLSLIHI